MNLEQLVSLARKSGASDLHLESGLPAAIRIRGSLDTVGNPIPAETVVNEARAMLQADEVPRFLEQRSFDLAKTISGVRCRINLFQTSRGMGISIRLLASVQPTMEHLNLHPDIAKLADSGPGLILVSGATGSGKSSTLAALLHEVNAKSTKHIITIEHPIEYEITPRRSYVRQREVGRDTPSFEQAITDSMREDPDVIMIGEVRTQDSMRLALQAAETGHLVLATIHASTAPETCQRLISAFAPEIQASVSGQLGATLLAVVCQKMTYRKDQKIRVPECEILRCTGAVTNILRSGHFHKLRSAIDLGVKDDMWSFDRYRDWLNQKREWYIPGRPDQAEPEARPEVDPDKFLEGWEEEAAAQPSAHPAGAPPLTSGFPSAPPPRAPRVQESFPDRGTPNVIDIEPVGEENVSDILSQIKRRD